MNYKTLANRGEGIYREKGSKFLGYAYPVESIRDIDEKLSGLRKEFHDATHHCYAYVLGIDGDEYRANDDGEPRHSAGDPILGQIRSAGLTQVLVVVIRYYGGTKLGVSGLIQAYKKASQEALNATSTKIVRPSGILHLEYGYDQTAIIQKLISQYQLEVVHQQFEDNCTLQARYLLEEEEQLMEDTSRLGLECQFEEGVR